jgi:hypothetical protein
MRIVCHLFVFIYLLNDAAACIPRPVELSMHEFRSSLTFRSPYAKGKAHTKQLGGVSSERQCRQDSLGRGLQASSKLLTNGRLLGFLQRLLMYLRLIYGQ